MDIPMMHLFKLVEEWLRMYRRDRTLDSLTQAFQASQHLTNALENELVEHPDYKE